MRPETLDQIGFPNFSIRIMCEMLDELGLDKAPAMKAAGIDHAQIDDPNGRVSGRQELSFQHAYVRLTGYAPLVWLQTGLRYRTVCYGAYGFAMLTARTLRRSLQLSSLFGDLHYSLMNYTGIADGDGFVGIGMDPSPIPEALRDFSMYRALGSVTTILHDIWHGRFPLTTVEVTLPEPPDRAPFERELQAPVHFGAGRNAWLWPEALQDVTLPMGSSVCEETYERQCAQIIAKGQRERPFIRRCLDALQNSDGRYCSAGQLAQTLCLSERTLQRLLAENGLSYRALLDHARYGRARDLLLNTGLRIETIGEMLGYSELAAFTRAFTRWSGDSPSAFRRREDSARVHDLESDAGGLERQRSSYAPPLLLDGDI